MKHVLPIDEIAFNACGLVALPETPPYVVRLSAPTAGHGVPSERNDINPCTVLIAETPSAFPADFFFCFTLKMFLLLSYVLHTHKPSYAALAIETISVMFGVSLTKNGILTASRTHKEIFLTRTGS